MFTQPEAHRWRNETKMERLAVKSATMVAVGYDQPNQALEVEFHHRAVYCYAGVPVKLYRQLLSAESKGKWFRI